MWYVVVVKSSIVLCSGGINENNSNNNNNHTIRRKIKEKRNFLTAFRRKKIQTVNKVEQYKIINGN